MNSYELSFSRAFNYGPVARYDRGVFLEVTLAADARTTPGIRVYVDSAATFCVFGRQWADGLGLDWEVGDPMIVGTAAGTFSAYRHEVSIRLFNYEWVSWVAFAEWDTTPPSPARDVLGLTGFFDHFLVAIDDLSEIIYLEPRF
jgi:hypothetical protein